MRTISKTVKCTVSEFMTWYFGSAEEVTPKDLRDCDFAYDLIDSGIFEDYSQMSEFIKSNADVMIEVTSQEDKYGTFDTSFEIRRVAFDLMSITPVGDINEEE